MRAFHEEFAFVSLKINDNLYCIAQLLTDGQPIMRFFNILNDKDNWDGLSLTEKDILFEGVVGTTVIIRKLATRKIKSGEIANFNKPFCGKLIRSKHNDDYPRVPGSFPNKGGDLIDIGENGSIETTLAPIIKHNLTVGNDREIILKHCMDGMWTLKPLVLAFEHLQATGVFRDVYKQKIFPELLIGDEREDRKSKTYFNMVEGYGTLGVS